MEGSETPESYRRAARAGPAIAAALDLHAYLSHTASPPRKKRHGDCSSARSKSREKSGPTGRPQYYESIQRHGQHEAWTIPSLYYQLPAPGGELHDSPHLRSWSFRALGLPRRQEAALLREQLPRKP